MSRIAITGLLLGTAIGAYVVWPSGPKEAARVGASRSSHDAAPAERASAEESNPLDTTGADRSSSPERAVLWQTLTRSTAELRAALADAKRYPELAACQQTPEPKCTHVLSEALRTALAYPIKGMLIEHFTADKTALDARALRDLSSEILATSDDPTLRAPLIMMIDMAKTYLVKQDVQLDSQAYSQLAKVTDVEKTLLLREFAEAPIRDAVTVQRVEALALLGTESTNVRTAAIGALASLGSGAEVAAAVTSLRNAGALSQLEPADLGRTLARCGSACSESILSLAQSASSSERMTALTAVANARGHLSPDLVAAVRSSLVPTAQQEPEERDQVAYIYGDERHAER